MTELITLEKQVKLVINLTKIKLTYLLKGKLKIS